jgi:CheY-like chemotaxis protein
MKILVVEDEESVREVMAALLRKAGHEVEEAEDGLVGIQKFRLSEPPFDCVISDYVMPRKNGLLMLAEIRKMDPKVKLILQTATLGMGDLLQNAGIGDVPVLWKPWERDDLFRLLEGFATSAGA